MSPIPVVLLKSSARSCSTAIPDPYAHLLSQPASTSSLPSYSPAFLEVFNTELIDDGALERILLAGSRRWRGVVISSGRSIEAWRRAGERLAMNDTQVLGKGKGREVAEDQHDDDACTCSLAPDKGRQSPLNPGCLIARARSQARLGRVFPFSR